MEHGADILAKDKANETILFRAFHGGQDKIFEFLLESSVDTEVRTIDDETVLFGAVRQGQEKIVQLLLRRGGNINAKHKYCNTVLHVAAAGVAACEEAENNNGSQELVRILLKFGANIDAKNPNNETALFGAIIFERVSMVELLLAAGVEMNVVNSEGRTAVMEALQFLGTKWDSVKCLLEAGATVTDTERQEILRRARGVDGCDTETDRWAKNGIVKMLTDGD